MTVSTLPRLMAVRATQRFANTGLGVSAGPEQAQSGPHYQKSDSYPSPRSDLGGLQDAVIVHSLVVAPVQKQSMARAGMTLAPIANSTTTQQLRWLAQIKSPLLFTDPHHSANFRYCDAHSSRWAGASMRDNIIA